MMKEDHEDRIGLCVVLVYAENDGKKRRWELGLK